MLRMQVSCNVKEWRVEVRLKDDCEEATYIYDLMHSGRLMVESKETLPLPFRGQFLFKVPEWPRPLTIQVARLEASAEDILAGHSSLTLLISTARGPEEILTRLESALREVPPASEEEFKADAANPMDEYTRVRKLTHAQRIIYSTKAGQSGRAILIQQPNPLLLLYLCKNPLITLPEVIQIAKLPSIDALVAEYIVRQLRSNPQWGMNEELKLALCVNPKTPGGAALSLLKGLNSRNLRQIAKQGEVRQTLKQAAMRLLLERRD
jgi:hypothetical protein